ncbi:MAG: tetratricopeptide repeat protein, partial [candidate division Zixibacteria bacterium]|nr:tetratricopeptide repeat protein [candidate division Zixibacteria bacterium]
YAEGWINRAKGEWNRAITSFQAAGETQDYLARFELASTYLQAGELGKAVDLLQRVVRHHCNYRASFILTAIKAEYLLGVAYERSGWRDEAQEQFDKVASLWSGSETDIATLLESTSYTAVTEVSVQPHATLRDEQGTP